MRKSSALKPKVPIGYHERQLHGGRFIEVLYAGRRIPLEAYKRRRARATANARNPEMARLAYDTKHHAWTIPPVLGSRGQMTFEVSGEVIHHIKLFVRDSERDDGVAQRLLIRLERLARERGVKVLRDTVLRGRDEKKMIHILEKLGYQFAGHEGDSKVYEKRLD